MVACGYEGKDWYADSERSRGPVSPARVAEERNRLSEQGLAEMGERANADLVRMAKEEELEAWDQFNVSSPVITGARPKDSADTRWALA